MMKLLISRLLKKWSLLSILFSLLFLISSPCRANSISTDTLKEIPNQLPLIKNSFIERADKGLAPSGFKIRGIKGLAWTPEQYLEEIPVLAKYKMNFMMNCYLSMFTKPPGPGMPWTKDYVTNDWWLPLTDAKKQAYEKIFAKARQYGINFCFSIHPQLSSSRPANLSSDKDFEDIWQHYAWAQSKGVHWFSVTIDDVASYSHNTITISGEEQSKFVNKIQARLRKKDKDAQVIFCPTHYNGIGADPTEHAYLEAIAKTLDKDVYVFWTGLKSIDSDITVADAEKFKSLVGHRLFLWDNYPVNDNSSNTVHLAPIRGRDTDLYKVIDGYMSNSSAAQNEINRVPLFTIADYTYDPQDYNPWASIGQSIIHQTDDKAQRQALLEVVKLYSSEMKRVKSNPVLDNFNHIIAASFSQYMADAYIDHLKVVQQDLNKEFPKRYTDIKNTLAETIRLINESYKKKYGVAHS